MGITAAVIDARGWAINVTFTHAPGTTFANYALDPDGTPKFTLTCSHGGYEVVAGVASAKTWTRTIYGTQVVRKTPETYTAFSPDAAVVQETNNGDGTITVKIALSESILSTASGDGGDTSITLAVAAGWCAGESGQSGISVTNSSAVLMPRPGHRWADVPSRRVTGSTIRASLVAFSYHPMQLRGLAAVKFTMRDTAGTIKTAWATSLTTSTTYGDTSRLYEVDLDVSTGTPFVAGLVRIDAELYPWLGSMRSTDNGTGMTSLATVATQSPSQRPDCVAYDPAGTRYRTGADYIHISSAGTATASSVTVGADAAAAKAGTHAADLAVALHAAYLANRTISGLTRPIDGMVFVFAAGTHNVNPTNKSMLGIAGTSTETWITLSGDLTDSNPSVNCILEAAGNTLRPRNTHRIRFSNMTAAFGGSAGTSVFWSNDAVLTWWDAGSVRRGSVGRESSTAAFASGFPAISGAWSSWATGAKAWKYGRGWMAYGYERVGLVRGCQTSRKIGAGMSLSNTWIQHLDTSISAGGGDSVLHEAPYGTTVFTELGASQDYIQYGNDMRSTDGKAYEGAWVNAATGGTPVRASNDVAFPYISYQFHINNLLERISNTGVNMWGGVGENQNHESYCCLFEGNTLVGQRNSFMFCKPLCGGTVATDTQRTNWSDLTAFRNNLYDKTGQEADRETVDTSLITNNNFNGVGAFGYSPYRVECYAITYGTDCEGNVNFGRLKSGDANNYAVYLGRGSSQTSGVGNANAYKNDAKYVNDLSLHGPVTNGAAAGTGQGDYHPATGSLALARATRANSDRTIDNAVRTAPFASGAFEGVVTFSIDGSAVLPAFLPALDATVLVTVSVDAAVALPAFSPSASFGIGSVVTLTVGAVLPGFAPATSLTIDAAVLLGADVVLPGFVAALTGSMLSVQSLSSTRVASTFQMKAPASVIDWSISHSLDSGETITSSTWSVAPIESGGLTVEPGDEISGNETACLVSGGVYRHVYELTNTVVTSLGRTLPRTLGFRIGPVEG